MGEAWQYPGSGKTAPGSNLLTHQGCCVRLFRSCTAQGAISKGMLFTLWTSLSFKNIFEFITASLMWKVGYVRIIYAHFLSDGRKGTRCNKIGLTRLPELFLIVMKNVNSPLFYVQRLYIWHPVVKQRIVQLLSLIHIWRCRRVWGCRSRWSPYH